MQQVLGVENTGEYYFHSQLEALAPELEGVTPLALTEFMDNADRFERFVRLLGRTEHPIEVGVDFSLQHKGSAGEESGDHQQGRFDRVQPGDYVVLEPLPGLNRDKTQRDGHLYPPRSNKRYALLAEDDGDELPEIFTDNIHAEFPFFDEKGNKLGDDAGYQVDLFTDLHGRKFVPKSLPLHPKSVNVISFVGALHEADITRTVGTVLQSTGGDLDGRIDVLTKNTRDLFVLRYLQGKFLAHIAELIQSAAAVDDEQAPAIATTLSYGFTPMSAILSGLAEEVNDRLDREVLRTVGRATTGEGGNVAMPPQQRGVQKVAYGMDPSVHLVEQMEFVDQYWSQPLSGEGLSADDVWGTKRSGDLFTATVVPYEADCPTGRPIDYIASTLA